jgi:chromosome segregation ATPase
MTANALGDLLARTYARRTELQTTFTAAGRRLSDRASETARLVLAAAREWSPVGGAAAAFAGRIALDQTRKLAAAQATLAELWPQVATLHEVVRNRDEQIAALRREVQAVSERLGRTSEQTAAADARLGAIYASRGWALLQWLQAVRLKLAPRGSFRERLLHASLRRRPRVEREGPAMRR